MEKVTYYIIEDTYIDGFLHDRAFYEIYYKIKDDIKARNDIIYVRMCFNTNEDRIEWAFNHASPYLEDNVIIKL